MTGYELKKAAIEKLHRTTGNKLSTAATMLDICRVIGRHPKGGLTTTEILMDYLQIKREVPKNLVPPPYRPPFRPMTPKPHPRMADIQRAQPPMMTMQGIGNYKQPGGFLPEVWR